MLKFVLVLAIISRAFSGPAPPKFFSNEPIETDYQERSALLRPRQIGVRRPISVRRPIAIRRPTTVFLPTRRPTSLLSSLLGLGVLGSLFGRSGDLGSQLQLQIEDLSEKERTAIVESALTEHAGYYDAVEAYESEVEEANEARKLIIESSQTEEVIAAAAFYGEELARYENELVQAFINEAQPGVSEAYLESQQIDALFDDAIEDRSVGELIGAAIEYAGEERLNQVIHTLLNEAIENGAKIDVNGDGMIDRNEFHWTFPELDLYEEFGKIDVNNDGFISIDEL